MPRIRAVIHPTFVPLSSLLYVLAFPNFNQAWLAWAALIPLTLFILRVSPRQAFLSGWLAGLLAYSGLLYWIIVTFQAAHLPPALAVLSLLALAAYLGLYWGFWAWFLASARSTATNVLPFVSASAWAALELARTHLFSGFPWTLLGDSQYRILPLIQMTSLTGVYGLSFLIVLMNTSLALVLHKGMLKILLPPGLLLAACLAFGAHRLSSASRSLEPKKGIRVALLQGSIDQYKKWDQAYVQDIENAYARLVAQAAARDPHLIIWPETSVPGFLLQDPPLREWLTRLVKRHGAEHLIGAPIMRDGQAYNSAFVLDSAGDIRGEYAKRHLVPFGEFVPWAGVLGRWISALNDLGGFAAGRRPPVLTAAGQAVGITICYEAIFPNLARDSVRQGAELIANLTNDGWYMKTAAPGQHFAPNVLRAVENGRWMMRADNTGVTALIDPYGRIHAAAPIFEPAVIEGSVEPRRSRTPYTRFGDWLAWLGAGFCAWISLRAILRR